MTRIAELDLSIVIVNYRGWDRLERCLSSLRPLAEGLAPGVEIIVVDNDSGDGRLDEFARRHPFATFVANDGNWGFADACNLGARGARGEFLLFFNPDAEDPGGGVAALLREARAHPEHAILTARLIDENGRPQKAFDVFPRMATLFGPTRALLRRLFPARYADPRREIAGCREVDWVSGAALLVRRDVFEQLGGFCNGFFLYSEDVDLCRRARDAGHAVAVCGAVTLRHAHGGISRANPEMTALTKSEVVVSRHFYASRHFGRVHARVYHAALFVSRFLPLAPAALVAAMVPAAAAAVKVRALMFRRLAHYYRGVPGLGWRSRRARPVV